MAPNSTEDLMTQLSLSLGQLRADFSSDQEIQQMFSQPLYWSELVASRPCFLVGGRGTGKTTTLRALGFRRQARITGPNPSAWHLIGAYWRVESNVTSAFAGARMSSDRWIALFSHYVNLRLCDLILDYLAWTADTLGATPLIPDKIALFCMSIHLEPVESLDELRSVLAVAVVKLEAGLNSDPETLKSMPLSILGQPIRHLLGAVNPSVFPEGVSFAFCVDEYENFLAYQQRIINTLVKHVGDSAYTFKIGVRSTTRGERSTLAIDQPLQDAVDYTTIDIVQHLQDQSFMDFAASVCEKRLEAGVGWTGELPALFVALTLEEEALKLGVERLNLETTDQLKVGGAFPDDLLAFEAMTPLSKYMVRYWAMSTGVSPLEVLREACNEPKAWATRLGNYSYASLFTIRSGLRGIRKYYAGWPVICHLAAGNIRTLLRLVHEAMRTNVANAGSIGPISAADQTEAATRVGQSILGELQRTSRGGELIRLTLSLGRVFGGLAASPEGRAPEVNQFRVSFKSRVELVPTALDLLDEGVAGGAFEAFAGNKQGRLTGGTKAPDYQLSPVFAPYFVFSHRRKRRLTISEEDLFKLASNDAAATISRLLQRGQRSQSALPELPDQLRFYEDFLNEA